MLQKVFLFCTLFTLITISLFGLLLLAVHHHEPGCPFMPGEQVICDMSAFAHISAWQRALLATLPQLALLFLGIILLSNFWRSVDPLKYLRNLYKKTQQRNSEFNVFSELFSSGILHPKIP